VEVALGDGVIELVAQLLGLVGGEIGDLGAQPVEDLGDRVALVIAAEPAAVRGQAREMWQGVERAAR
jgi:hypothetical protein